MTYYADLSPCDYFPFDTQGKLLSLGWLDADFPYARGNVDRAFIEKLAELLTDPWQPAVAMGRHECQFCRFSGGPPMFNFGGRTVRVGASNVFLPASGVIYVAPSLILHYIDSHGYAPPEEFQRAVLECPPMKSIQYLRAILANGGRGWMKGLRGVPLAQGEGRAPAEPSP
jgi:hypothetical protein